MGVVLERLATAGFSDLATAQPAVLTSGDSDSGSMFEAPEAWSLWQETSYETLPERLGALLEEGPALLVPPWERAPAPPRRLNRSSAPVYRYLFEGVLRDCRPAAPGSALAVLLPATVWVSEAPWAVNLRVALAEHWDIVLLVYGYGALSGYHNSLMVSMAFLKPRSTNRPPLKVFRFSRWDDEEAVEEDFKDLLARGGGRLRFGYVVRPAPAPSESLAFDLHDPTVAGQRASLADFGSVSKLEDLYEQLPTLHLALDASRICSAEDPGAVRLLGGRDIGRDGTIAPPQEDSRWGQAPDGHLLAAGDLVLREIYGSRDPGGLVVAQVTAEDLPAAATNTTVALRPRAGLDPQQLRFVLLFLRTPLARTLAIGDGLHLSRQRLRALPIPQPDEALAKALDDLTSARDLLEDWKAEASSLLESAFTERSPAVARSKIIGSGRTLRLRVEAASLLDGLGHAVRTRFPYPVALRWRETEVRRSTGDLASAYAAVLETAEILLCYSALLTAALARAEGIDLSSVKSLRYKLANGRGGPGLGEWTAVLDEIAGRKKRRTLGAEHPLHELGAFLGDEAAKTACKRLAIRRNNESHTRRADQVDLPSALQESSNDLALLVTRARFLADWPLIQITSVEWDTFRSQANLSFRRLMGDHPVVPTEVMEHRSSAVETGSLYVIDSDHHLHLLRPFLAGQLCPTCRTWSTFHIDKADGQLGLKSLEHGHWLPDFHDTASLQQVGLL